MVPTDLRLRRSIVVAAGVSALVAAGLVAVLASPELSLPQPPGQLPATSAGERVVVGPLQDRTGAWLTVGDAAARVRVRFASLPGQLYRISTASDAGVAPVVTSRDGRVVVRLEGTGKPGLDELRIVLNRDVRWDLRFPEGAGEQQLNLRGGRVTRVDVGSAGLAEVWLPDPDGTVPVTFTGGVGTALLSLRNGAPVQVRLAEGAGSVKAPWIANNGTAAGTVLREPGFRRSQDRYTIRAEGGLGALVIRRSWEPGTPKPGNDRPGGTKPGNDRPDGTKPGAPTPGAGTPGEGRSGAGRSGAGRLGTPNTDARKAGGPGGSVRKTPDGSARKRTGTRTKAVPPKSEVPKAGGERQAPSGGREPRATDGPPAPGRSGPGVAGDPAAARKPGVRPVPGGPGLGSPGTSGSRTK